MTVSKESDFSGDGTNLMGVQFAPLNVPAERRLQTLAVVQWVFVLMIAPFIIFVCMLYLLFYTSYWWTVALYLAWLYYDWDSPCTGGYNWTPGRTWAVWKHFRNFFPMTIKKTAELSPEKNYIFGCHPHGIISYGIFGNIALMSPEFRRLFPDIKPRALTLKSNFYLPLRREYFLLCGGCDVSKESIRYILSQKGTGHACCIVVGGAEEALDAHPDNFDLTLGRRKGFIKMALQTGASLVPVFSFGENSLYQQIDNSRGSALRTWQSRLKSKLGFSPPIFFGRGVFNYSFGMLPYRHPVVTVVGAPVDCPQLEEPSREQVNDYHQKYIDALSQLFEAHKADYGIAADKHLNIV